MTVVEQRIQEYHRLHGTLPEDLNDLPVFPNRIDRLEDGWGRTLKYSKDGENQFRLESLGADGVYGGSGLDADVIRSFSVEK